MNFEEFKKKTEEAKKWLQKEFAGIRTGAASAAVLDTIKVEAYGSLMPLHQLANIGIEDAQTLAVTPFDGSQLGVIQKALTDSSLGLSISVSGNTIRLSFPELTIDRKGMLVKLAKEKLEEAKVSIRKHRDETKNKIEEMQQNSEIGKDEEFRLKEKMEEITKDVNNQLEEMLKIKEEEINK